jgi:ketosteroid isomerase-like protein
MSALAQVIEEYHASVGDFLKGDPEPQKRLWSRRDDITLANPLGPPACGWQQVEAALDRAGSLIRGGEVLGSERISAVETSELAYIVEIEQFRLKVNGGDEFASGSLRVTTIFRKEDSAWRVVHRHADPITASQAVESLVER